MDLRVKEKLKKKVAKVGTCSNTEDEEDDIYRQIKIEIKKK